MNKANPLDVASLLKQFFRELPDPILTLSLRRSFVQCALRPDDPTRTRAVLLLCLLLPASNLATLRYVMCFLQRVAKMSAHNKMDVSNLAICFAPNLLRSYCGGSSNSTLVIGRHQRRKGRQYRGGSPVQEKEARLFEAEISVVLILITEASNIGIVPDELLEIERGRTECSITTEWAKTVQGVQLSREKKKCKLTSLNGLYNFWN